MAIVYEGVEDRIAHLPGVVGAVSAKGDQIAGKAEARLAAHRRTGQAKIEVERGITDTLVSLVDPAAMSLEFGRAAGVDREGRPKGRMEPLHILTGAVQEAME